MLMFLCGVFFSLLFKEKTFHSVSCHLFVTQCHAVLTRLLEYGNSTFRKVTNSEKVQHISCIQLRFYTQVKQWTRKLLIIQ